MINYTINQRAYFLKFFLIISCLFLIKPCFSQVDPCLSQSVLTCGTNANYSLTGTGEWSPPGPWGTPGAEQVFVYTALVSGSYDIQVTNDNYYVDLFIANSCGPAGWTFISDIYTNEVNPVNLLAGVTYYFLIDDENTTTSSGIINVSCLCIPPLGGIDQSIDILSSINNYVSTTIASCNDCSFRTSNDRVLEVEITCQGDYSFSLCNQANWDTYIYLSDQPCGGNVLAFNDDDCGLQSGIDINLDTGVYYLAIEGYSSSSSGAFDVSITTTCSFPILPVTLLYFNAENNNSKNNIEWLTLSEINNDYFIVERSENGFDFVELGKIKGNGNLSVSKEYTFVDDNFKPGINYYRLKQFNYNGTTEIFKVVSILNEAEISVSIYPNPTNNIINLTIDNYLIQPVLSLHNSLGQTVLVKNLPSSDQFTVKIKQVPGIYYLKLTSIDGSITKKIIVK
tara:strand:+ start:1139 stop:2497 length:1359 start_codon:yes stop_codon:yes gene_type:complete